MNLGTVLLALSIFAVIYQAVSYATARTSPVSFPWARTGPAKKKERQKLSDQIGLNKRLLQIEWLRRRLDLLLVRSGHPFDWQGTDALFMKELMTGAFPLIGYLGFSITRPLALLGLALAGFFSVDYYLKMKTAGRQKVIQKALPGIIDLLALGLESGMDLMAIMERVLEKMKRNALWEELKILIQEIRLGTSRQQAFAHLAHRVDLPDVNSLVSMIKQAEELGSSLAMVLRNYAEDMRVRRIQKAEEAAGKLPVKLLFPMMVFFFPIVFVVIFGPMAMTLLKNFRF